MLCTSLSSNSRSHTDDAGCCCCYPDVIRLSAVGDSIDDVGCNDQRNVNNTIQVNNTKLATTLPERYSQDLFMPCEH